MTSMNITCSDEYTKLVTDNINRSFGHEVQSPNIGLCYTHTMFCLSDATSTSKIYDVPDDVRYSVFVENNSECTITKKSALESCNILQKIRDDLFNGQVLITCEDGVTRPLKYCDVVFSGSVIFTTFYNLSKRDDQTNVYTSNDINVYIVTPNVVSQSSGISWSRIISGTKYRFIKFPNESRQLIYGRYDLDICRGSMEFINDNIVKFTQSYSMVNAIKTGYCILGMHTTRRRINKFINFGLGIFRIPDTKIIDDGDDSKTIFRERISELRCNYCFELYETPSPTASTIDMRYLYCDECLSGVLVDPDGKYMICDQPLETDDVEFLVTNSLAVFRRTPCNKLSLPSINVSAFQPNIQKKFLMGLGVSDRSLISGYHSCNNYKHTIELTAESELLRGLFPIIKIAQKTSSPIYKATLGYDNENITLGISIYFPSNMSDVLLRIAAEVSGGRLIKKDKTPIINGKKYRSLETDHRPEARCPPSVMYRLQGSVKLEEMSLSEFMSRR